MRSYGDHTGTEGHGGGGDAARNDGGDGPCGGSGGGKCRDARKEGGEAFLMHVVVVRRLIWCFVEINVGFRENEVNAEKIQWRAERMPTGKGEAKMKIKGNLVNLRQFNMGLTLVQNVKGPANPSPPALQNRQPFQPQVSKAKLVKVSERA